MAKPKTLAEIFKAIVEQSLADREIAWTRKDGGLQLALFGNPIIRVTDESIQVGLVCGTSGYHGSKDYHYIEIRHGDPSSPDCDPEATINKILSVADSLSTIMDSATNVETIQGMRRVKVPGGTAKALIRKAFKARGYPKTFVHCCSSSDIKVWFRGKPKCTYDGDHDAIISYLEKDGAGVVSGCGSIKGYERVPFDEIVDSIVTKAENE